MKKKILAIFSISLIGLSGAAHADMRPVGPDQEIKLDTVDDSGKFHNSHCLFENASGAKTVVSTDIPHIFAKAAGKTTIKCESTDGIWHGAVEARPKMDTSLVGIFSLPWTGMVAGTAMLSGGSSRSDSWSGGAVTLPDKITVPMTSSVTFIKPATYGTEDEAIESAPPEQVRTQSYAGGQPQQHKVVHHHVRHHAKSAGHDAHEMNFNGQ